MLRVVQHTVERYLAAFIGSLEEVGIASDVSQGEMGLRSLWALQAALRNGNHSEVRFASSNKFRVFHPSFR